MNIHQDAASIRNAIMWNRCILSGTDLDKAVARLLNIKHEVNQYDGKVYLEAWKRHSEAAWEPSRNEMDCAELIASNQIFLQPPHVYHFTSKGGGGGYVDVPLWRATVSSDVRTYRKSEEDFTDRVGRGSGETWMLAVCRAIVVSFGLQS